VPLRYESAGHGGPQYGPKDRQIVSTQTMVKLKPYFSTFYKNRSITSYDEGRTWTWNPDATLNASGPAPETGYHPSPGAYPTRKIIYIVWLKVTE
jgi:hypothetical protein